jgi:hypothetical protein
VLGPLFAEQLFFGLLRVVMRLAAHALAGLIQRRFLAAAAMAGDRDVHRDAVQPRIESAVASEGVQFAMDLNESVLGDVFGLMQRPANVQQSSAQSVLIFADQAAESGGIAVRSCPNPFLICGLPLA